MLKPNIITRAKRACLARVCVWLVCDSLVCTHTYTHASHVCAHTYIHVYTCSLVCTVGPPPIHTYMHLHQHIHIYVYTGLARVHTHTYMYKLALLVYSIFQKFVSDILYYAQAGPPVLLLKVSLFKTLPNMTLTIADSLMRMFSEGPDVSLRGSPTVSPVTAFLCATDPFP